LKFFLNIKISNKSFNLKLFQIDFHKIHFWNTTFSKKIDFDYVLFSNNVCLCYMILKLVFKFKKLNIKKLVIAQRGRTHGEGATVWMTKGMWSGNSGQWESQSSIEDERVLLFSLDLLYIFILTQEMEIAIFSPNGEDLNPLLCNFRLNKFTPHLTNNKIQL
jgi:hypothetical protein